MSSIFITGTDTGCGKTVVTGLCAQYLHDKGKNVITQKWIQTGSNIIEDVCAHLGFMGMTKEQLEEHSSNLCPYVFKYPSSPHLSAKLEGIEIDENYILEKYNELVSKYEYVIVEGIGGALVPINSKRFVIDIVEELHLPVVIVVGNKLGAINHTLLTVEAIKKRNIPILGLLFNTMSNDDECILKDNIKTIGDLTGEKVLGSLPFSKDKETLVKSFRTIGELLFE